MMQTTSKTVDFFLGATTPAGFKGYFEPLRREPGMRRPPASGRRFQWDPDRSAPHGSLPAGKKPLRCKGL